MILYSDHDDKFYIGMLDDAPMRHDKIDSIIPVQPYCASCVCSEHVVFMGTQLPNREFIGTFTNVDTKEQWPLHMTVSTVGAIDGVIVFITDDKLCYYDLDSRCVRVTPFLSRDCTSSLCGSMCGSHRCNLDTSRWVGIYDGILRTLTVVRRCLN